ncbi:hypothetical protein K431DRAFT_348215 [Polychaeton citri CBS 116435]|uniref:L domain-like protein n=1 Tax=Polychaeton citri CBS 116435 TaxID=1314669 RepID=A0A9P4UM37_9PEZI|nr:hypothetical protein K431DRAFT_348215 [Polychaeton citri CBS 116435]
MESEDGLVFVKNLAYFVRTHEKALANALQLQRQRHKPGQQPTSSAATKASIASSSAPAITLAEALSRPYLSFASTVAKPAKLALTPHHLFYLLNKFEDLGVDVGPTNVRLENLQSEWAGSNYVSFLGGAPKSKGRAADTESLRSVSSVRSVMSSMSSMWSHFSLSNSEAKTERKLAQHREDVKYLYSCFTKIPALRLCPDQRAHLIRGFEDFPLDTAVPLFVFKNLSMVEIIDLDFRQFYGWDRLAEQVRSLILRRASVDDPLDVLLNIVLDDMDKRRRRSSKIPAPATPSTPGAPFPTNSPKYRQAELARSFSAPNSPLADQRRSSRCSTNNNSYSGNPGLVRGGSSDGVQSSTPKLQRSFSPTRPPISRHQTLAKRRRAGTENVRRESGSSGSSTHEMTPRQSSADLSSMGGLPSSKWRFLRHLSLAENALTFLTAPSLAPVAETLQSLDLSGNLFSEIPDALATLTNLRALNLSNCMIESLSSLSRSPLPAITTLNLRSNRLFSLVGIERLYSLERVDLRDNRLHDPTEVARLTGLPDIIDVYVAKNPFTKTHGSYRITVFNLFRSTPGHLEDVVIDSLPPTSSEKKQLVDRAPEQANVPVVRPPPEDASPPPGEELLQKPLRHEAIATIQEQRATPASIGHRRSTSDFGPNSTSRKKKGTRRRIVELSQAEAAASPFPAVQAPETALVEASPRPSIEESEPTTPHTTPYHTAPTTQIRIADSERPRLETGTSSPTPGPPLHYRNPSDENYSAVPVANVESDAYRQKIEALKNDLGPHWLSAFNDDQIGATPGHDRDLSPSSRKQQVQMANNQGVSIGNRTLG